MFIQTQATSDPRRMNFLPGREVLAKGVLDLRNPSEAAVSPLARALFAIPGIAGVTFDRDSITVTRTGGDWAWLKPQVLAAIMDHFVSGAPLVTDEAAVGTREEDPARRPFREALRGVIDPELGYNIVDLGLVYDVEVGEGREVRVTMTTTTPGCPATGYLKEGAGAAVEAVPGVGRVEVVLTYEPRWTPAMMSPEAKAHFGIQDEGGW